MNTGVVIGASIGYLGLLFGVAYLAEWMKPQRRKFLQSPLTYALTLAVYCTAWTYYGSVGRAASTGIGFLPIYLGPTLMAPLLYLLLRKVIAICKSQRISSLADFLSARYGKSTFLGSVVTIITLFGIIPYISLQLKAISLSFEVLVGSDETFTSFLNGNNFYQESAFYITIALTVFTIFFGARHLEATRHHHGLVAAIAFESIVKLIAFLLIGIFVTFGIYNGFGDLFSQALAVDQLADLLTLESLEVSNWSWFSLLFLSMFAILLLPRQFHIAVVENIDLSQLKKAIWLFPLYLLIINIFVLPIAFGGYLHFGEGTVDADTYVLHLPLAYGQEFLTLIVFIGGLAAATGMVIVSTIGLSLMVNNNLLVPLLLKSSIRKDGDFTGRLIGLRRLMIAVILMLAYGYFHTLGERETLVSIGLISFVAVAQFAPSFLGALYWKGGTKTGVLAGLISGSLIWAYTLPIPALAEAGIIGNSFLEQGPFGWELLRPYSLLGLEGLDHISHATFWSLAVNTLVFIVVSLYTEQSALCHTQSEVFVDFDKYDVLGGDESQVWNRIARQDDLRSLLTRFLGKRKTNRLFRSQKQGEAYADAKLVARVEKELASALGAASARLLISTVVKEEPLSVEEVINALDETQQLIHYSQQLERQSKELEAATKELRTANDRLQEMDKLKDEFITTMTHELRTPITSIKSLSNILLTKADLPVEKRQEFLAIIAKESERLARLVTQVLDLEKMESGHASWNFGPVDLRKAIERSIQTIKPLAKARNIGLEVNLPAEIPVITGDEDRLIQVIINLLSNAVKFCEPEEGKIALRLEVKADESIRLQVKDNGIGISREQIPFIFDRFTQFNDFRTGRPQGSGLGLSISHHIVTRHGGSLSVTSEPGKGSCFTLRLPQQQKMHA